MVAPLSPHDPHASLAPIDAEVDLTRRARRRLRLALAGVALAVALPLLVLWAWTRTLPSFATLRDYRPLLSTRVLGANGEEVFAFARERRTVVPLEAVPEVLRSAVLAAEDARFYRHEGVNYLAILRCAAKGLLRGGVACGGSTITQQVVKTFLLQDAWRVKRKVQELVLAPRLEQNLSKDEILFLYLNQIYLGHRRYGVEEASRFYFGKSVRQLTLGEAACLAGVVQSPERLSPVKHPAAAKKRQAYVLRRMAEEGFITAAAAEAEMKRPIEVSPPEAQPPGVWYADAIRRHLDARYGAERVETDGLTVEVAMDPVLQRYAEAAVAGDLRAVDRRQGYRGPLLHLGPEQLATALPAWRARLAEAAPRRHDLVVWDLSGVDPDDIEPGESPGGDVRRMIRLRALAAGEIYAGLVTEVTDAAATVDLGGATGTVPLADVRWARKWNPTSATATPRSMAAVLQAGDVVLARVMPGRLPTRATVAAGRPLSLSLEQRPLVQGALVALEPATRQVRALVGGSDFRASQFNRALQARRQPGSAFKPFVWGAALETRRFTPATVVYDVPDVYRDRWTGKEWKPRNFERDAFDGPMLLARALAESKNTVSVKLTDALGVDAVIAFARRLGIESDLPRNLTLALGTGEVTPLELVNAYASLAAQGRAGTPVMVLRVLDRDGQVLEAWDGAAAAAAPEPAPATLATAVLGTPAGEDPPAGPDPAPPPEFTLPETGTRPDVAYVLVSMMKEVVESGTGAAARALGRPAAAKTGTAQEHRDAWFVGMTPELVAGVWIGFDDHAPLGPRETGAGAALPGWLAFMQAAVGDRPAVDFPAPAGVEFARVDQATGLLAGPGQAEAPLVPFLAGTAPTEQAGARPGDVPRSFFLDQ
jgi:penicillin-binding protein 1A